MKKILTLLFAAMLTMPTMAAKHLIPMPRLVVGLVIDQMRWDYLYYYYDEYRVDGLRKLLEQGYSFENTMLNYVPMVTAAGHASIYTGTVPALHGIASNNFLENGRMVYCCDDSTVQSVGSTSKEGLMSPRKLLASGLGDQMKIASDYRSKVIGIALKDRSAILPAGHGADGAYWWDTSAGKFVTSTYYMDKLPVWAERINNRIKVKPGTDVKTSVDGVTKTFQMAEAAIDGENLGKDEITDLLAISVSSTDAIGHTFGTRGKENYDTYMEVDRQVANLIDKLDGSVGRGNYLLFLTADHGAAHNPNEMKSHRIPAGGLNVGSWLKDLNATVAARLGVSGKVIMAENAGQLYLDHELIAQSGKTLDEAKQVVIEEMQKRPDILFVVDRSRALTTSIPEILRERIVNGYNVKRSGDLFYIPRAGWENVSDAPNYKGTTHGEWNPYDAHVPFVLFGWDVEHGESVEPTNITDIVPTVCAMLHIQVPNSCIGQPKNVKYVQPKSR